MIVINNEQFIRLMEPLSFLEGEATFNNALIELYGIKSMKAHEMKLHTNWNVYFVDDNAELIFKLKYGEYL